MIIICFLLASLPQNRWYQPPNSLFTFRYGSKSKIHETLFNMKRFHQKLMEVHVRQQATDVLTWLFSMIAPRNKYKEYE